MNIASKLACMGATVVAAGLMSAPATAVTAHCADQTGKVEINGPATVQTDLEPGTTVCIKAGTQVTDVVVAADGTITNTTIKNKNGKPLGISYYVPGEPPTEEPPCEPDYSNDFCEEEPS